MSDGPAWVEQARRLVSGLGETLGSTLREGAGGAADGGHPADCRWCPVCQVAAVVRGERPEVTAALADVLGAAAAALRSFSEGGREAPAEGPDAQPGTGTAAETAAGAQTGTETVAETAAGAETGTETAAGTAAAPPPPPAGTASPVQRVEIA
ncbi:hypothetical protein ACI79D_20510 [Geodermatophilus sp. SYSU D00708]